MTLRARIMSMTVALAAVIVLALVTLYLNRSVTSWLENARDRADATGRQIQALIVRHIEEQSSSLPRPDGLDATKTQWSQIVVKDRDLAATLEQAMALSRSIIEINVAGEDGRILTSSNPARLGEFTTTRVSLQSLLAMRLAARMFVFFGSRDDYELRVPLGIAGQSRPVFIIQILVSPILLRGAARQELVDVLVFSFLALLVSLGAAYGVARFAVRPLDRIGHLIDAIANGNLPAAVPATSTDARELALIESKLSVLGERFRDARQDATQLRSSLDDALSKLDAGARSQIQNQLAVSSRLTAISSLTARVAHEIKNPLNSIALRLELLRSVIAGEVPAAEPEFRILAEEVTRLDRVVRTFLDFNRPVELAVEDVSLNDLVPSIAEFLEPEARRNAVNIHVDLPDQPLVIRGDSALLRQALLNIAVNALEAMPGGGNLYVYATANGSSCELRVADTGPGISPEIRQKIFQLYFTTKPNGSGIGLAMTFRAIQLHGGSIDLEDTPGHGATFCITLPCSPSEAHS